MQPLRNEIAVQSFEGAKFTKGGLIIPEAYRQRQSKATVISVGASVKEVKKGDIIFHVLGAGKAIKNGGEKIIIIPITHCLAVIPCEN